MKTLTMILFLITGAALFAGCTAQPISESPAVDPSDYRVCYKGQLYCKQGESIYVQCSGAVQLGEVYPGTEVEPLTCGDTR